MDDQVAMILNLLHEVCPDATDQNALLLHAFSCRVAAELYCGTVFEQGEVISPQLALAVEALKSTIQPLFRRPRSANIYMFPLIRESRPENDG